MSNPDSAPKPPPAWSTSTSEEFPITVVATYGAQSIRKDALGAFLGWFSEAVQQPDGPLIHERARFDDAQGYHNQVHIAYWRSPDAYAAWACSDAVSGWWEDAARSDGDVGVWREVIIVPSDRMETILSAPSISIGSARLASRIEGPIKTHGYWGSMRDRLPISRHDPLLTVYGDELLPAEETSGSGRRLRVRPPANLTLIRSGQDTRHCSTDELNEYQTAIRPVLQKGMDFLRDNPEETGCCSCRFMEELDEDGERSSRSFGFAWFLTLAHLERWSKSHPTHLAIYNRFSAFAKKRGDSLELNLWHEVAVVPKDKTIFEYVNCHARTGIMGFFEETGQR